MLLIRGMNNTLSVLLVVDIEKGIFTYGKN
jgi:hypothetical protein